MDSFYFLSIPFVYAASIVVAIKSVEVGATIGSRGNRILGWMLPICVMAILGYGYCLMLIKFGAI